MKNPTELIDRYFRLARGVDTDAYLAQFADDAIAEDEGHEHHGLAAIRAWRAEVPPVSYTVDDVAAIDGEHVAHAEIAGDFPGSPVTLAFRFVFSHDGRIQRLAITH
jgi:hypothetical protein